MRAELGAGAAGAAASEAPKLAADAAAGSDRALSRSLLGVAADW